MAISSYSIVAIIVAIVCFSHSEPATARKSGALDALLGSAIAKSSMYSRDNSTHEGDVLSKAELGVCLKKQRDLERTDKYLTEERARLEALDRQRGNQQRQIELLRVGMNSYSEKAVSDFNKRVRDFNRDLQADEDKVGRFNQIVARFDIDRLDFDRRCAGKRYYQDDYQSLVTK